MKYTRHVSPYETSHIYGPCPPGSEPLVDVLRSTIISIWLLPVVFPYDTRLHCDYKGLVRNTCSLYGIVTPKHSSPEGEGDIYRTPFSSPSHPGEGASLRPHCLPTEYGAITSSFVHFRRSASWQYNGATCYYQS